MKKRVFISGAIKSNKNYKKDFNKAKEMLIKKGYEPICPAEFYFDTDKAAMSCLIPFLCCCEYIYVLENTFSAFICFLLLDTELRKEYTRNTYLSDGSSIEQNIAEYCGIKYLLTSRFERDINLNEIDNLEIIEGE